MHAGMHPSGGLAEAGVDEEAESKVYNRDGHEGVQHLLEQGEQERVRGEDMWVGGGGGREDTWVGGGGCEDGYTHHLVEVVAMEHILLDGDHLHVRGEHVTSRARGGLKRQELVRASINRSEERRQHAATLIRESAGMWQGARSEEQ